VIAVSLQCHLLHDLITVLETLWEEMHMILFSGKSKKSFFAISIFIHCIFLAILGEGSDCQYDFIFED